MINQIPYTIEGLADSLGCDRHTIVNYGKKARFFTTISKTKTKILRNKLERGLDGTNNSSIAKFDLINNYDYRDKTEVDSNVIANVLNINRPKPRKKK